MIRLSSICRYELEVRGGIHELFNLCRKKMSHVGDLLLCQQNGFIGYNGFPCVGLGDEGLNSMQIINSISYNGIGKVTENDDYFIQYGNTFFNGISEFEKEIQQEKSTYLNIWENAYFLRTFTQVVNILNSDDYDWNLTIGKLPPNGKSKHIREQIINRLTPSPKFQQIIQDAYNSQIRNAIAHSQYHCVQGGIFYDNYGSDKYATLQGLSYDDWERKYVYSYFILIGIFQALKQINYELYIPASKITLSKGIPVKVPNMGKEFYETYLFPNEKGDIWRFVKV